VRGDSETTAAVWASSAADSSRLSSVPP